MTDKQTPPDWVLIEAAKRSGWGDISVTVLRDDYEAYDPGTYRALCDTIEKYEQPPLNRKMICAREAAAGWPLEMGDNGYPTKEALWDFAVCAIELWEEGFGQ